MKARSQKRLIVQIWLWAKINRNIALNRGFYSTFCPKIKNLGCREQKKIARIFLNILGRKNRGYEIKIKKKEASDKRPSFNINNCKPF